MSEQEFKESFISALYEAGWTNRGDAQHENIIKVIDVFCCPRILPPEVQAVLGAAEELRNHVEGVCAQGLSDNFGEMMATSRKMADLQKVLFKALKDKE